MTNAARLQIVVEADTGKAEGGLASLGQKVASFGQTFNMGLGIGAGIAVVQGGVELLGRAFGALKGTVVDVNQQLDAARASMGKWFDSTESLNNSLTNLQNLANATPFQFPALVTAQQRTISVARSADELRQNMDAITVAAAEGGKVSAEQFDRMSLALGQIATKGKVQGEELMQLNEAGINAAKILANYFQVAPGQLMEMVEQGKVSSQDMFAALRQNAADPRNRQALDELAKTWEGALSTIGDVLTTTGAKAARPFFDLMTEGANQVATFLQGEDFKVWAEALQVGIGGAVEGIKGFLGSLAPVGETIATAFKQLTDGDFSGAFATIGTGIQTALSGAVDRVREFGQQMFGGGMTLVEELAGGILAGASSVLQSAIDGVTSLIASFLIGNSPPAAGPLAAIREGGANTIAAWGEGAASAADQAVKPAADKIASGLDGLKDAGKGADAAIREIGRSIAALDSQTADLKFHIDDIKDGYKEQLEPLEAQLKAITQRTDYEAEEQRLLFELEEAELRRAEAMAQGSREVRARIDDQIEELNLQKQAIQNAAKREELERKARGERSANETRLESLRDAGKDRSEDPRIRELQDRLDALRDGGGGTREKTDAERALEALRNAGRGGGSRDSALDDEKEALRVQEARLKLAEQARKLDERAAKGEDVTLERQQLALDEQQLILSIKEHAAKKEAAAEEAKRQQQIAALEAQVRKEKEAADRAEQARKQEIAAAEKELAAAKRKEQDDDRARQQEIVQLERTVRDEKRQAQMAEAERARQLADIDRQILDLNQQKADLADKPALAAVKDAQDELKERRDIFETAQKEEKLRRDMLALPARQEIERIKAEQEATLKPLADQLESLGRQKSELSEQRQQWQAVKSEIAAATAELKEQEKAAKEAAKSRPVEGAPKGGLKVDVDEKAKELEETVKKRAAKLAESFGNEFKAWIDTNFGTLVAGGIGVAIGGIAFGPIGAVAGGLLGVELWKSLNEKLTAGGFDFEGFKTKITDSISTLWQAIRGEWKPPAEGEWVDPFVQGVGEFGVAVKEFVDQAWPPIKTAFTWLKDEGGPAVWQAIKDVAGWFGKLHQELKNNGTYTAIAEGFRTMWQNSQELWGLLGKLVTSFKDVNGSLSTSGPSISNWGLAIKAATAPGFTLIDLLATLAKMLVASATGFSNVAQGFKALVSGDFGKAAEFFGKAKDSAGDMFNAVGSFSERWWKRTGEILGTATQDTKKATDAVATSADTMQKDAGKSFEGMATDLEKTTGQIERDQAESWKGIAVDTDSTAFKLGQDIRARWDALRASVGEVTGLVQTDQEGGWLGVAQRAMQGLRDGVQVKWDTDVSPWLQGAGSWIVGAVETYGGGTLKWLLGTGKDVLQGLKDGVQSFWDVTLKPWLDGAGTWVINAFASFGGGPIGWLADAGSKLVEGFKDGIFGWLKGDGESVLARWIRENLTDRLPNWVKHALGINSPSTVFQSIGQSLIDGLLLGMRDRFPQISSFIGSLNSTLGGIGGGGAGSDLIRQIGELAQGIGGPEFARAAMAVASSETSGGHNLDQGPGLAKGPFQFDPGGELQHFARMLRMSLADAGQYAIHKPLEAARYALEGEGSGFSGPGYLGRAISEGLRRNLHGRDLAEFASKVGQRPFGDLWRKAGDWYEQLFPGLADGAIVRARAGGLLARIAEGGRDEAVIPLPHGWDTRPPRDWMQPPSPSAWMQSPTAPSAGDTYIIDARGAVVYDGSRFEDMLVGALGKAHRHGRIVKVTR